MAKKAVSGARRAFLASIGTGGLATAAAVVAAVTPESPAGADAPKKPVKDGYQVSDHINKYYRTTRV